MSRIGVLQEGVVVKWLVVCLLVFGSVSVCTPSGAVARTTHARTSVFRGSGWVLTITSYKASYGQALRGSLTHAGKTYHMEGDWIPAADAGGDLLRFFGQAFPGTPNKLIGLVGVATLYDTCEPNCAASSHYLLKAVAGFSLPGTTVRQVILKLT